MERLNSQLQFIQEIDNLKTVLRRCPITDGSRLENSAEHSWHVALMAVVLAEHANEKIDVLKVVKMLLIHDIVEIDAGDTFVYDEKGREDKLEREQKAADRIFNILPEEMAKEFRALWDEYEEKKTPEAKFGASLDRLSPMLQNFHTKGLGWKKHNIEKSQALKINAHMEEGSSELWKFAKNMLEEATERGYLRS